MDDATAAEIMYGSTSTPAAPAQRSADDIAASRLYGETPAKEAPTKHIVDPAARLFGGPDTEPVVESEPREPSTEAEQAEALFGKPEAPKVELDIPPAILAERQTDKDRAMFSPQQAFKEVLPDSLWDEDPEAENIPEHVRVAVIGELRECVADLGMDTSDVKTLRELGATFKEEPSEDQVIAWREEAVDHLNRTFGNQATQALRDAQAFIAQDSRRVKWLELNNRGDHPKVIEVFAKLGRKARLAGKLKAGNGKR